MGSMITFIFALLLVLLALLALTLEKTYFYVPRKELKREAAHNDRLAATLFRAATYGSELRLLLWIVMGLGAAGGFVLFARVAPLPLGFVVVALVLWLGFTWLPRTRLTLLGARLAERCTPGVVEIMRVLHPILRHLAAYVGRYHLGPHTGLYEREDMEELLERQGHQSDNRISDEELERMRKLLKFGDYDVGDIVVPRKQVLAVNINDAINPVLLDDLHKSGHPRFPVCEGEATTIVGTLPLDVIADTQHRGGVRDYYDNHLAYVHEGDSLEQALRAFYETRQHLFIVVNSADDYVGIITLSDILRCLFGAIEHEQFGHYDDRKAVIERHRRRHSSPTPVEPEPAEERAASEKPDNVVE
jgi:CBS domain containing-hemolysin-like protein